MVGFLKRVLEGKLYEISINFRFGKRALERGKVTIGTYKEVKKQEDGWFPKAAIGNKII